MAEHLLICAKFIVEKMLLYPDIFSTRCSPVTSYALER